MNITPTEIVLIIGMISIIIMRKIDKNNFYDWYEYYVLAIGIIFLIFEKVYLRS